MGTIAPGSDPICQDECDDKQNSEKHTHGPPLPRATSDVGLGLWRNRRSFLPPVWVPHRIWASFLVDRDAYTIGLHVNQKGGFYLLAQLRWEPESRLRGCCVPLWELLFGEATMASVGVHADPRQERVASERSVRVFTTLNHPCMCRQSPCLVRMNNGIDWVGAGHVSLVQHPESATSVLVRT